MLMFKRDTFTTKLFRRVKNKEMKNTILDKYFQKRTRCDTISLPKV